MRVVRHLRSGSRPFRSPVVALGNFDGLHLGHHAIVGRTRALARERGSDAIAFTFSPHPIAVLAPRRAPAMITSLASRLALLREAGLDGTVVQRFTRAFAALTPEEFVREVLVGELRAKVAVVSAAFRFGAGARGDAAALLRQGAAFAELGDKIDARLILQKLIQEHPTSPEAARAKRQIAALGS